MSATRQGRRHRAQQHERLSQLQARQIRTVPRRVLREDLLAGQGTVRSHQMSADAFLRACMRDVAWNFFYGWVNFDHVIGTRNHYGRVDFYAGTFNGAEGGRRRLPRAVRCRPHHGDLQGDPARLGERGLRSVRRPGRDRQRLRHQAGREHRGDRAHPHRDQAHARPAGRFAVARRHAGQPRLCRRPAGRAGDPGRARLRGPAPRLQPLQVSQPLRRHLEPVGHAVCKASLACPTTEEYILPVFHGNDRVEWFIQLSDKIVWEVADKKPARRAPGSP